jgi:hypothetical protein
MVEGHSAWCRTKISLVASTHDATPAMANGWEISHLPKKVNEPVAEFAFTSSSVQFRRDLLTKRCGSHRSLRSGEDRESVSKLFRYKSHQGLGHARVARRNFALKKIKLIG